MDSKGRVFVYNGTELMVYDELHGIFLPKVERQMVNRFWGDFFIDASDNILLAGTENLLIFSGESFKQIKEYRAQRRGHARKGWVRALSGNQAGHPAEPHPRDTRDGEDYRREPSVPIS